MQVNLKRKGYPLYFGILSFPLVQQVTCKLCKEDCTLRQGETISISFWVLKLVNTSAKQRKRRQRMISTFCCHLHVFYHSGNSRMHSVPSPHTHNTDQQDQMDGEGAVDSDWISSMALDAPFLLKVLLSLLFHISS